jgi:hypothetical protein
MSTTPPEDRPTERIRPTPPQAYESRAPAPGVDPNVIILRLENAIGSLRTGLMLVGAVAVAALGVALYALLGDDGGAAGGGAASDSRVAQLEDRVDRLSRQLEDVRSGGDGGSGDTAALDERVGALERTVKTLAERPAADPQEAIDELASRIDALSRDVEELQDAQPTP